MGSTAFVLGGGGVLGAVEVGMLRALSRADISPDLVVATRFARELAAVPEGVTVHVLPTGDGDERDDNPWAYRDAAGRRRRVSAAYAACRDYLSSVAR